MSQLCKLTTQALTTLKGTPWTPGEWRETNGVGPICGPGWLHGYHHPLLAMFLNQAHARLNNPRLWTVEVSGEFRDGLGLKFGTARMRLVAELPLPSVTSVQYAAFAILCSMTVPWYPEWRKWAEKWLSGEDRTVRSAVKWTGRRATVAACRVGSYETPMVAETSSRAVEELVLSAEESELAYRRAFPYGVEGHVAKSFDLIGLAQRAMEIR
jgi:hypothetical protein